jgi:hypothetical protein
MSRGHLRLLTAALTFGGVFLLGWLACGALASVGTGQLHDGVGWALAASVIPLMTVSTTVGALAPLVLLRHRIATYGRRHSLGRIALGAIITLLLCPLTALAAFEVTSAQELDRPAVWTGSLVAAGLVAGAAGLTIGLRLPLPLGER